MTALLAVMDLWSVSLPAPVALGLVAILGYFVGHRNRGAHEGAAARSRRELRRAEAVARELEKIAWTVRRNLGKHHASLNRFKRRISGLSQQQQEAGWKDLCREASEMLTPTLRLASQIAGAYDEIRQQTNQLMAFSEARTDPLTGINNHRGLDDFLAAQVTLMNRYGTGFSVAIFDIDQFKNINDEQGRVQGDRVLQKLAHLIDESARETDFVARYGGEEFLIAMPRTDLDGGYVFAERIRSAVEAELPITISAGVAAALDGDTPDSLLARADAALSWAKAAGRNCVCRHDGSQFETASEETPAVLAAEPAS